MIGPVELAPDPPAAGGERETLIGFVDYFRSVMLRKLAGLDQGQLAITVGASALTLAGLLKHMAGVEDHWFTRIWLGQPYPEPWATEDDGSDPDWDFHSAVADTPEQLHQLFTAAVERSRRAIADARDLDALAAIAPRSGPTSLRWILVHMVEEYARHCGHADLIREAIDGTVDD